MRGIETLLTKEGVTKENDVSRICDCWILDRPLYIPSAKYSRLVEWFGLNRLTPVVFVTFHRGVEPW